MYLEISKLYNIIIAITNNVLWFIEENRKILFKYLLPNI